MPFGRGKFRNLQHDPVVFLGFLGSAFITKVSLRDEWGGDLDDDVSIFTSDDFPLKWLVSDRQSSSTER